MPMRDGDLLEAEVKVLVTLLDALETNGALSTLSEAQLAEWREARQRWDSSAPSRSGSFFFRLLGKVHEAGAIKEGWILQRWFDLRARIENRRHPKKRR